MKNPKYNCVVVLGPTASGKTRLACRIASELNGEIISADSRQVYRHLNTGTGKDLEEYFVNGKQIPYHLINICEPGNQFFLHDFIRECEIAFKSIIERKKTPVICGGTGLYLDSLRKDFSYTQAPEDQSFRKEAENKSKEELISLLENFPPALREHADLNSRKRIIRAIEVARFFSHTKTSAQLPEKLYHPFYIGVDVSREERVKLISARLRQRLQNGLVEEAKDLLERGISHDRLQFFGLEYKFLSLYLKGELSFDEMESNLETAIVRFSKRQMTWFRKMEKEGVHIHWIKRDQDPEEILGLLRKEFSSPL